MSALALAIGRLAPGVWRGGSMPSATLAALAEGLGWPVRRGEITTVADKTAFLTQLGAIAGVPAYVRPNWDSLADGLRDISMQDRQLIVLDSAESTPFDAIAIEVLSEAVSFWDSNNAVLQVVWFGPVDAPSLDDVDPPRLSRG